VHTFTILFVIRSDLVIGEFVPPDNLPNTDAKLVGGNSGFQDFGFKESDA